jgi:hypothetical protein
VRGLAFAAADPAEAELPLAVADPAEAGLPLAAADPPVAGPPLAAADPPVAGPPLAAADPEPHRPQAAVGECQQRNRGRRSGQDASSTLESGKLGSWSQSKQRLFFILHFRCKKSEKKGKWLSNIGQYNNIWKEKTKGQASPLKM